MNSNPVETPIKLITLPYIILNKDELNNFDISKIPFNNPPLWIRTLNNSFCGVATEIHDLSLLLKKASLKSQDDYILIQKGIKGKIFYAIGKRYRQKYILTDVFNVKFLPGFYRVPYQYWSTSLPIQKENKSISQLFNSISEYVSPKSKWLILELIETLTKLHIAYISAIDELDISLVELQKVKQKIMKSGEKKYTVFLTWLLSAGGKIEDISGVDIATKTKDVEKVRIILKPGDVIKHISDIPSRDKTGFIITKGKSFSQAYSLAKRMMKTIQIKTNNLIL